MNQFSLSLNTIPEIGFAGDFHVIRSSIANVRLYGNHHFERDGFV